MEIFISNLSYLLEHPWLGSSLESQKEQQFINQILCTDETTYHLLITGVSSTDAGISFIPLGLWLN